MLFSQVQKVFYFLFFFRFIFSQTNVAIVSEKVGTEIDIHENRFYRIFPDEKGFFADFTIVLCTRDLLHF